MKTMNEIKTMIAEDRAGYFNMREDLYYDLCRLESIYMQHRMEGATPNATVWALIEELGADKARALIATLVNRSAWDGRISKDAAAWAKTVDDAWDEEAANKLRLYTDQIHMAHLNQLAMAMIAVTRGDKNDG